MNKFISRLRKAPWSFKQPLTKIPEHLGIPISDLFFWRNSEDWETFFELTDIAGLFDDNIDTTSQFVTMFFFDSDGLLFHEQKLDLHRNRRRIINLTEFTSLTKTEHGTFCIFHSHTPDEVSNLGSFLAERGYVSYCYKGAPIRSYVHGNLDAIAQYPDKSMKLLGSRSYLSREYRLQHRLTGPALYEIGVVNPVPSDIDLSCIVLSSENNEVMDVQKVTVQQRGVCVFPINVDLAQPARIVIKSHLVMARPLVFRIHNKRLDVFHG